MDSIRSFLKRMNRRAVQPVIVERFTDRRGLNRYGRLSNGQIIRIGHVAK